MSRRASLEDVELLLIDGDNLLHDVRGSRDEGGVAWLLPRLSAWRPDGLRIVVALDGHPAPGDSSRRRVMRGIEFHHSGSRSADDMLVELLSAQPYADRARTALVTRDRGLQDRARRAGGVTRSVDWLIQRVNEAASSRTAATPSTRPVGIGQGKPPRRRPFDTPDPDAEDRPVWRPGRGATKKKGNARRSAKRSRRR